MMSRKSKFITGFKKHAKVAIDVIAPKESVALDREIASLNKQLVIAKKQQKVKSLRKKVESARLSAPASIKKKRTTKRKRK